MFTSSAIKRNRLLFRNKMAPAASFLPPAFRTFRIPHSSVIRGDLIAASV